MRRTLLAVIALLVAMVSFQTGASLAKQLFPLVGPVGTTTLRLGFGLVMLYIALNLIVVSDSEAAKATAGVTATVVALLGYWGLRVLGRRALARPKLEEEIQRMEKEGHGDPDYYI